MPNIKPEAQNLIHDFINAFNNRSQLSAEAEAFFEEAMTILQNNLSAEVDFEEMYIGFPVPDYNYQGPKQKIPNQIVLDTGEVIEVTFVTYTDDNISSDQEVAELLINALKISLENANLNLSESEKISSINVYATTNGEHAGPNHSNGTAIDINRINGERMAMTGLTNQIKEFQIALDNFQYIRENFGPFFKHKYSVEKPSGNRWNYDYPVGGHKDHIHFSVRQ